MTADSRGCIFCGEAPLSLEHVFPAWLGKLFPGGQTAYILSSGLIGQTKSRRDWRAPFATTRVRAVCRSCNHGWMRDLENAARPFLARMIQGKGTTLDRGNQAVLARWVVKTAFIYDQVGPLPAVPPAQPPVLLRSGEPPDGVYAWIVSNAPRRPRFLASKLEVWSQPDDDTSTPGHVKAESRRGNGYGVTLNIGHVTAQVFWSAIPRARAFFSHPRRVGTLLQIWPPNDKVIHWPGPGWTRLAEWRTLAARFDPSTASDFLNPLEEF